MSPSSEPPQPIRLTAGGSDLDEAIEVFSAGYAIRNFRTTASELPFSWRHTATGDAETSYRSSTFAAEITASTDTGDDFIVLWNRQGTTQLTVGGEEIRFGAGIPVVLPTDQQFEFHHDTVRQSLVHMSRSYLEAFASHPPGERTRIAFETTPDLSPDALRQWNTAMRGVAELLASTPMPGPMLLEETRQKTASAMLAVFPLAKGTLADITWNEPTKVARARDFVHAYARLPITSADVAEAAGLSVRGLQQAFQRHLQTSPTAMIRAVRLDQARQDLLNAQGDVSVAEIAERWGFAHLGRFAGAYRERFGELPNRTLRRPRV